MTRQMHFISGLPRSGSTLLAALLRQNPRFHADMSGPLAGLFGALLGEMSGRNEFSLFISDEQRQRLLRGLFENYYGPEIGAPVIFDTNRTWCMRLRAIRQLFPQGKVIACVRDIAWIVDSIERLVQRNAFSPSTIFNYSTGGTVYTRANAVAGPEGLVGLAYDALKQAFYGDDTQCLMLVQYDTLVNEPARALAALYEFIGEAPFEHDFENVNYDASEFDTRAGTPGLHEVRPRVQANTRATVLPPDLVRRFSGDAFWRDSKLNPRGVRVV
ncbi:sulfotransferase [Burkholderia sp. WAC0059]|uniref:sulfotransferase family protein n=1 Tax=Burkholderia sp. WAC0059 TaxID=2066022 RepID=UPI000C7EB6B6|nr:sulfotransferase [Burkholderia sp. WAC0059]PLZ02229.1 sulfotransferase [Burkholderia sp. WAC0059]